MSQPSSNPPKYPFPIAGTATTPPTSPAIKLHLKTVPCTSTHSHNSNISSSVLHPRVAVLLGVDKRWHIPLLVCRGLSMLPAAWWGLRCGLTFLAALLWDDEATQGPAWSVERRFRITEVFLAIIWCCASAYLSYFFTDCLMSRWLLYYTPQATLVRLLTINSSNAYISSWVLYLSGGSEDPRLLLPAWISIAGTLTVCYHLTQRKINIKRETVASMSVFSTASFISMCALLLQLHLTRENDPPVPLFVFAQQAWVWLKNILMKQVGPVGREL